MAWFGCLYNRLMDGVETEEPFVGMGATELCWSDRHAYTVVKIKSKCRLIVQRDKVEPAEGYDYFGNQVYNMESNPNGYTIELIKTKKGWKTLGGCNYFMLGKRMEYIDPSF